MEKTRRYSLAQLKAAKLIFGIFINSNKDAKRALARGDDPELVIQRIADYRSHDKDDPNYYARHTVMKAQADLSRHRAVESSTEGGRTQTREMGVDH